LRTVRNYSYHVDPRDSQNRIDQDALALPRSCDNEFFVADLLCNQWRYVGLEHPSTYMTVSITQLQGEREKTSRERRQGQNRRLIRTHPHNNQRNRERSDRTLMVNDPRNGRDDENDMADERYD
jgi:hypothetical protein